MVRGGLGRQGTQLIGCRWKLMDAEQEGCGDSSFVSVEMSPLASFADLSWLAHLKL